MLHDVRAPAQGALPFRGKLRPGHHALEFGPHRGAEALRPPRRHERERGRRRGTVLGGFLRARGRVPDCRGRPERGGPGAQGPQARRAGGPADPEWPRQRGRARVPRSRLGAAVNRHRGAVGSAGEHRRGRHALRGRCGLHYRQAGGDAPAEEARGGVAAQRGRASSQRGRVCAQPALLVQAAASAGVGRRRRRRRRWGRR